MFPIQSDGAKKMMDLEKIVDKILYHHDEDEENKDNIAKQEKIKLGAPALPRAGLPSPK